MIHNNLCNSNIMKLARRCVYFTSAGKDVKNSNAKVCGSALSFDSAGLTWTKLGLEG